MSTNNGVAPSRVIEETVEKKVNGVVITASPEPTPSAIKANKRASLPEATPTASPQPRNPTISASNRATAGPRMNCWDSATRSMAPRTCSRIEAY